jgi:hypothetical protein
VECKVKKSGEAEMIHGMRGSEAAALGTIGHQQVCQAGIMAWPEPEEIPLDQVTTDKIRSYSRSYGNQQPPASILLIIDKDESQQKNIQGYPGVGISKNGEKAVKKIVLASGMDNPENYLV